MMKSNCLLLVFVSIAVSMVRAAPTLRDSEVMFSIIAGLSNKAPSWTADTPLAAWEGVTITTDGMYAFQNQPPNKFTHVSPYGIGPINFTAAHASFPLSAFIFPYSRLVGAVDLNHLPLSMQHLDLTSNDLVGDVSKCVLPVGMKYLQLGSNDFSGTFMDSPTALPRTMIVVTVASNQLRGNLDLSSLPATLTVLDASENMFESWITLASLPASLESLSLDGNSLYGAVQWPTGKQASNMNVLTLSSNAFTGGVDAGALPRNLTVFDVSRNAFNGSVDFAALPRKLARLQLLSNKFTGSMDV